MKTPIQLAGLDEALIEQTGNFTKLPKISAPYTSVLKRATVTDFSADGLPKMGVERIMTPQIVEVVGETDANGLRVFKPTNDVHDRVRFVGTWTSYNTVDGQIAGTSTNNDFVEITFYGTGLNLLTNLGGVLRDVRVSIDGGANGSNIAAVSTLLNSRNYNANYVLNAASGLALGLHTAKITVVSVVGGYQSINGFEILNTAGTSPNTLQLPPAQSYAGGKKLFKSALSVDSYNSNFESGTLGTKGGRVVVYQKADGTVAKAVNPTNASQLTLTSADHTNESLIRSYNWREFGANRSDDFSTVTPATSTNRAFTLDDGTTTLVCQTAVSEQSGAGIDTVFAGAVSSSITITFVGTGLDVFVSNDANSRTDAVTINGTSVGSITATASYVGVIKICSGLPYGTHTIKLTSGGGAAGIRYARFMTYGPSKPSIPSGSVELANYYVMADYSNDTASPNTVDTISSGVLRKLQLREMIYSGTWLVDSFSTSTAGGFATYTSSATSDYVEYTFYGTGFNLRGPGGTGGGATSWTASLNGPANTNWTSYTTSISAGGTVSTWTASTGVISVPTNASRYTLFVSGLPLGKHTVRMTKTSGAFATYFNGFDIITPIHSPKFKQNGSIESILPVGSCSLGDGRNFGSEAVPLPASGIGIVVPGSTAGLVSANGVPGRTDGASVPASYVGQVISDTDTGFYTLSAGVWTTTNLAVTLPAGVWLVSYRSGVYWFAGSGGGTITLKYGIIDELNNEIELNYNNSGIGYTNPFNSTPFFGTFVYSNSGTKTLTIAGYTTNTGGTPPAIGLRHDMAALVWPQGRITATRIA